MRTVRIVCDDHDIVYPDGHVIGKIGEHNATLLAVIVTKELAEDYDYHVVKFLRGDKVFYSGVITADMTASDNVYREGLTIYVKLWRALTLGKSLACIIEAHKVREDGNSETIKKTPVIGNLRFTSTLVGADPDTTHGGITEDVYALQKTIENFQIALQELKDRFENLPTQPEAESQFTLVDGKLYYNGSPVIIETDTPECACGFDVRDGRLYYNDVPILGGQDGADGRDGVDGVSPVVTVSVIDGGHSVTVTDAAHPEGQVFDIMDGSGSGHSHGNLTELENISEKSGKLAYNGKIVGIQVTSTIPPYNADLEYGRIIYFTGQTAFSSFHNGLLFYDKPNGWIQLTEESFSTWYRDHADTLAKITSQNGVPYYNGKSIYAYIRELMATFTAKGSKLYVNPETGFAQVDGDNKLYVDADTVAKINENNELEVVV